MSEKLKSHHANFHVILVLTKFGIIQNYLRSRKKQKTRTNCNICLLLREESFLSNNYGNHQMADKFQFIIQ